MGIGIAALRLYCDLAQEGVLKAGQSVCDVGSQDMVPEDFNLDEVFEVFGKNFRPHGSSRHFMEDLGFIYDCIDIDGRHGAHALDLNQACGLDIGKIFDIVTNHGTTEHVFDQANCFRFIHELTKPGGVMIHILPIRGVVSNGEEVGYGGHGLYCYATGFFNDIAAANGYETLKNYVHVDNAGALTVVAMRRITSAGFVKPIQGIYGEQFKVYRRTKAAESAGSAGG